MPFEAYPVEGAHPRCSALEFRAKVETSPLKSLFPDEKHLVEGAKRVDFKLIVGISPGYKKFNIILLVDQGISLRQVRLNERLFDPLANVQERIIP
jgi:hypothetical protein